MQIPTPKLRILQSLLKDPKTLTALQRDTNINFYVCKHVIQDLHTKQLIRPNTGQYTTWEIHPKKRRELLRVMRCLRCISDA